MTGVAGAGPDTGQEERVPVAFVEFVAKSFIRLHVSDPRMRDLMWEEFEAALDGAREASASRMPWEKASQVAEVSGSQAHDVLQQMLWAASEELGAVCDPDDPAAMADLWAANPAGMAEAKALVEAFADVHRELSRDLEQGRLSFTGGEVTSSTSPDGIRRCRRCGVSIEGMHPKALYCPKHRQARQQRYMQRKRAKQKKAT